MILVGSLQDHAAIKNAVICTTLTSAMGMGGGQIPMIIRKEEHGTNNTLGYDQRTTKN